MNENEINQIFRLQIEIQKEKNKQAADMFRFTNRKVIDSNPEFPPVSAYELN